MKTIILLKAYGLNPQGRELTIPSHLADSLIARGVAAVKTELKSKPTIKKQPWVK